MAIYHLNMRSIGRTSHAAGTAGAHVRYITRPEAEPLILAQHMPTARGAARSWLDSQERADRKNARVCDKLNIALPRELDTRQRLQVVQEFCSKITQDRCPFYAVIHQEHGNDRENPHAHIILRDRDFETGKRVMGLSDSPRDRIKKGFEHPKAMDQVRELWAETCNEYLARAGFEERIDHRTLKAQNIEREPQIHVGAWSNRQAANDERPQSRESLATSWGKARTVGYPEIDQGKTRFEHNAEIIHLEEYKQSLADERARKSTQQQTTQPRVTAPRMLGKDFEQHADRQTAERSAAEKEAKAIAAKKRQDQRNTERATEARKRRDRAKARRAFEDRISAAQTRAQEIRAEYAKGATIEERTATRAAPKVDQARDDFQSRARRPSRPQVSRDFQEERGGDRLEKQVRKETDAERKAARAVRRAQLYKNKRDMLREQEGRDRGDTGRARSRDGPKD